MSKRLEVKAMLRDAVKQGFTYQHDGAGHWEVTAPLELGGKSAHISSSPKSDAGMNTARSQLKNLGYIPAKHRNRKKKNNPPKINDTGKEGASNMVEFRDIARVTRTRRP